MVSLSEQQKAQRKQMALDFEAALFEDPTFIQVTNDLPIINCDFILRFHVLEKTLNYFFRKFGGRMNVQ